MKSAPDFATFAAQYDAGRAQLVWTVLVADLETPVSAMMKLGLDRPGSFLLESVEGGAIRGRYSAIGFDPDVIWRCRGAEAEINRSAISNPERFEPCPGAPLDSLRALIAESRIELPEALPPMACGLFGYMGYDTVRLMERLPDKNPDELGVPDGMFLRPTIMAIFDIVEDSMFVVTPVWPNPAVPARTAYNKACERLSEVAARFERKLEAAHIPEEAPEWIIISLNCSSSGGSTLIITSCAGGVQVPLSAKSRIDQAPTSVTRNVIRPRGSEVETVSISPVGSSMTRSKLSALIIL